MSESMLNKDLEKFIIDSGLEDVLLSIKSLKDEFSSLFTEFEKEFKELDENQEVVKIGNKEFLVAGENPDGTPILKEKKNDFFEGITKKVKEEQHKKFKENGNFDEEFWKSLEYIIYGDNAITDFTITCQREGEDAIQFKNI